MPFPQLSFSRKFLAATSALGLLLHILCSTAHMNTADPYIFARVSVLCFQGCTGPCHNGLWECLLEEKSEQFSEKAGVLLPKNLKIIGLLTSCLPVSALGGASYV